MATWSLSRAGILAQINPLLLCDNFEVMHLSFIPVQHSRMKHIQIDIHFVHDHAHKGPIQVRHVHKQDQLPDLLTKPLSRQRTEILRFKIGFAYRNSICGGVYKDG